MRALAVIVAASAMSGCGLLEDRGSPVTFVSEPPGATARTSLGPSCVTPCRLDISRLDAFTVTFERAGFAPRDVRVLSIEDSAEQQGGLRTTVGGVGVRFGVANSEPAPLGPRVGRRVHTPNPVVVRLEPLAAPAR